MSGTSCMRRESHVRICERLGVRLPGPTRQIYDSLAKQHAPAAMVAAAALTASVIDRPMVVSEPHGGIIADIGDFFAWLGDRIRHGFEAAIEFVKDIANNVWNAVVRIAGEIYRVVIKDVVEFATWVYNKIKVAVEDVIKYLSFIFDIDDGVQAHHQALSSASGRRHRYVQEQI
jgi:hypothetical protein